MTEHLEFLNKKCIGPHRSPDIAVILAPTKATVEKHNEKELEKLPGKPKEYKGKAKGEFNGTDFGGLPAPQDLFLKAGARVMILHNDPGGRWVNGSLGIIDKLSSDKIDIKLDRNSKVYCVDRVTWEQYDYNTDGTAKVVGTYTQFPLQLAWALTVHKAQGLTLENVKIERGNGFFGRSSRFFDCGHVYTALSRVTSLGGLSFKDPLTEDDIRVDQDVMEHLKQLKDRKMAAT